MKRTNTSFTQWRKSSYSGGESGQCVEVAQASALVGIRDSKNPQAGHLTVDRAAFAALVSQVKSGDLNL
ncbi:DUF397 domain-containing protein [Actinomadura rubrisoli]|uniref:DUF397 domain-containing protein n=1 Tax=Actinomadura rubrisoli TaxID=2530368 RepID=A0A4R5C4V3_9ACTN|nr:DUF397 domain-containing protein [Actinomadura rubrisoli]TDD93010.1 DUF397 domain-containing protein [Actinomadura rubrisoli]